MFLKMLVCQSMRSMQQSFASEAHLWTGRVLHHSSSPVTEAVSYPEAWPGTTVCYSSNVEDPDSWKRNQDTFYMDGKLSWEHDHTKNGSVFFR
jgi:hypothetical protein